MNLFSRRSYFLLAPLDYLMSVFPRRSYFLLADPPSGQNKSPAEQRDSTVILGSTLAGAGPERRTVNNCSDGDFVMTILGKSPDERT